MIEGRREKLIYFGAVPILAAILGAIATVTVQYFLGGGGEIDDNVRAVILDGRMTPEQKLKTIELLNKQDDDFWGVIRTLVGASLVPMGMLAFALSERIRRSSNG